MRVDSNRGLLAASLVVGLALAACGQSASSAAPGGTGSAATPAGVSPSAPPASSDGSPSAEPTASQQASGGGGGGTGGVPALSDGDWTAGVAHADVSGDVSGTIDAPLLVGLATTSGTTTQLTYVATDGSGQIGVAINDGTVAVSVSTTGWVGGGGTTEGAQCSATFSKGDATSVAGTVTCTRAPVIDSTGAQNKFADITVTFEASR